MSLIIRLLWAFCQSTILGDATIGMDRIERAYYIYRCSDCGSQTTYEEQKSIAKQQKKENKKVIERS